MSSAEERVEAIRKRVTTPFNREHLLPVWPEVLDAMRGLEQEAYRRVELAEREVERLRRVAEAAGYWRAHEEGAQAGEAKARRETAHEAERARRLALRIKDVVGRLQAHSGSWQGALWAVRELGMIVQEETREDG